MGEFGRLSAYRQLMDRNGESAKQLWLTESGAPTGGQYSTDERTAAQCLTKSVQAWEQVANRGPMFFYTMRDRDGADREDYFGFVRKDGTVKPTYNQLQIEMGAK